MDQEASSSSFGSSTSTSTSNPEAEGRSTPPKPELAEQHQSTESGIGDDASFSVAHSASDDHNGSMFHAFSVDNSYKALKPIINVEGANNGVLFENRSLFSSSEGDDSLVNLDGIDLPSPNAMSNSTSIVRVEQVQQAAFYSDTGPSFQVSVSEQVAGPSENDPAHGYGGTSGSQIPIPSRFGISFDVHRVEENGGFSALFDNGSNTLVQPPPLTGDHYPIPIEQDDQTELYSEECQEYERMIKKAATVSKKPESAGLSKYLMNLNKKLDSKLYDNEELLKNFERQIKHLQLQAHLKGIEIESLRLQMAGTDKENDDCRFKIKSLEREVEWLKFRSDEEERKKHSSELPRGDSTRNQLARVEKQLETHQRKIKELEDENTRKDAEISRLQIQNAVTEAEAVKLEKEITSAMIKEKDDQIEVLVESVYQLIIEKGFGQQYLHVQMSQKSENYAHFFKERAESVAALHLEAPRSSFSAASVQFHTKRRKRKAFLYNYNNLFNCYNFSAESISTPIGADPILFEVGGRGLSNPLGNAHQSIASKFILYIACNFRGAKYSWFSWLEV